MVTLKHSSDSVKLEDTSPQSLHNHKTIEYDSVGSSWSTISCSLVNNYRSVPFYMEVFRL